MFILLVGSYSFVNVYKYSHDLSTFKLLRYIKVELVGSYHLTTIGNYLIVGTIGYRSRCSSISIE